MRRVLALLLISVFAASCLACARQENGQQAVADPTDTAKTTPVSEALTEAPSETPVSAPSDTPEVITPAPTEEATGVPEASATPEAAGEQTSRPTSAPSAGPTSAPSFVPGPTPAPTPGTVPSPTESFLPFPIHTPSVIVTPEPGSTETVYWNPSWQYADRSVIHTGTATLYHTSSSNPKHFTVCVNAGHGTIGGTSVYTLCHPDGSPKVTGGSTPAGSTYAVAVSSGTVMLDGTSEASATLSLAKKLKNLLLQYGFDVLMIRDHSDVQLDNVARTVMANNVADCHIALHYDSSESDKGFYCCNVAQVPRYLNMEPVRSHHYQHEALAACMIAGARSNNIKIYGSGSFEFDLTQTSYSTVPSANLEVGDKASDISSAGQSEIAKGLLYGVINYYHSVASNGFTDMPDEAGLCSDELDSFTLPSLPYADDIAALPPTKQDRAVNPR